METVPMKQRPWRWLSALLLLLVWCLSGLCSGEYIPPGPLHRCPKERLLLHPCSCDREADAGLDISCNNTNLASMSVALNNLATFSIPIETLTIRHCHIARLFGPLFFKISSLRTLHIVDTPIETIDEGTFQGINETLEELYIINSSLVEFPKVAFQILGNLKILTVDGHRLGSLPKDAFGLSGMTEHLIRLHMPNGLLVAPPPDSLQPLRKLKTLDLHGNRMSALVRNQFRGLRDLEILDISFNSISRIDGSHLGDLTKLARLNVSHNAISQLVRGAFARNTVLRVLNLSSNKLTKLDTNSFKGMRFLRRLYLSDNQISDVSRGTFGSLKRIGTIDLARNVLKKIDYQMFYELNFIEKIDVSENNVTEIDKLAFKDLFLTDIDLSKNAIAKIATEAFVNCANITKLDLSHNNISNFDRRTFDETTYATELMLAYNNLTELNQVPLHNMTGLKILNVSHNAIWKIAKNTFPKLYELHTIDLSHNQLRDIFNSVLQTLFSLRTLDMSHNTLETVKPSTFGSLPTLLELDLSHNRLKDMARGALARLASCRSLIVSHNRLKKLFQLPISVGHLDLSHNLFEELPPKLWPSMNSLLSLDFSHNRLGDTLVDGSFRSLLTLRELNLSHNAMTRPPWVALQELTSLQHLFLQGNNLTQLSKAAFGRLPVVLELDLSHNQLNNISYQAFEGLLQLLDLNLSHNNLSIIPNGVFQGLVSLGSLDLSHNRIEKLDNKTHSLFDDCLSLETLNLSHNKISFLSRKSFPNDPYIPYKLKEIDMSYNSMPVITFDLVFGTGKVERLNLSHNSIADIRKSVIGNLTSLRMLDLSHNRLEDLVSDEEFFRPPPNITQLYLSNNYLDDLPWKHVTRPSGLGLLDIRHNSFESYGPELTKLTTSGVDVYFEGNPLRCDCFVRPLHRYLSSQLDPQQFYKAVKCNDPPYLADMALLDVSDDRLNCPGNVATDRLMGNESDDYDITPDFKFRETEMKNNKIKLKWRVTKNDDIADPFVIISNVKNLREVVYRTTLPYFKRSLELQAASVGNLTKLLERGAGYQVCLLATDSKTAVRAFYPQQCRDIPRTLASSAAKVLCTGYLFLAVVTLYAVIFNVNIV